MTTKEDALTQAMESAKDQLSLLIETNRQQGEIITSQAKTIEELKNTIIEQNASLAWLKKKVFGKMSEKCPHQQWRSHAPF